MMKINLIDAEKRASSSPGFELPSEENISKIRPGHFVKLCFSDLERMWVKVTEVNKEGLKGTLSNVPLFCLSLKLGQQIEFEPKHIFETKRS